MMRSLAFEFRSDTKVYNINDQFMFGPSILVNPVVKSEVINRKIYLPEPNKWHDFWTGKIIDSGQTIEYPTPIETIPLFIKAGSVIPFGPVQQYVDEKLNAPIDIRIYSGADAEFVYYEDEGNNYNYEKGAYNTIQFTWDEEHKKLSIGKSSRSFKGHVKNKKFNIVLIEPTLKRSKSWQCDYDGSRIELNLN